MIKAKMFSGLIVAFLFLLTACAPSESAVQTTMPRNCSPTGSYLDIAGDASVRYLDILKVESYLEGEKLAVVFYLQDLPETITVNTEEEGYSEFYWGAKIDVDADWETGGMMGGPAGVDYELSLFHFSWGDEKTGPIEDVMRGDSYVWKYQEDESMSTYRKAKFDLDYDLKTITLEGTIPGITESSMITFSSEEKGISDYLCVWE